MRRVIIESPFAGGVPLDKFRQHTAHLAAGTHGCWVDHAATEYDLRLSRNRAYLRDAMRDCLLRGEAPYASHGLYTQVLDDRIPTERELGITAGLAWQPVADAVVVYTDLGISEGMQRAIDAAMVPVEYRTLTGWAV